MATTKATEKTTAKVQAKPVETTATETKATEKPAEVKAEQLELDVAASEPKKIAENVEKAVEKVAEKATAAKKAVGAKKTAVKKEAAKKTTAAKKTAPAEKKIEKKEAVKASVHVEFRGKSITNDELVQIAKDIWKYDFKKKVSDFKTVDIYVKPEESMAYYVINDEVKGSFFI